MACRRLIKGVSCLQIPGPNSDSRVYINITTRQSSDDCNLSYWTETTFDLSQ